jgi:formate-dependent nitrite reductase membrane component NrfD
MEREAGQHALVDLAKRRGPRDDGRVGTAHANPRDAYRDVPLLVRPTWNHEVAAYFYFGGISSGAYVVGALAELVGGPRLATVARRARWVAFAAMLACPPLLIDDLGTPSRFHHMLRIFKPSSPMNLGAWTLTVHGAFATLLAAHQLAAAGKLPLLGPPLRSLPAQPLAAAGLLPAVTLGGYTGVLLGTTSVPVWSTSPLLGGLFMASSLSTGGAAVGLAEAAFGGEERASEALTPLNLAFGAADLALVGAYVATSGAARKTLLRGKTRLLLLGATAATATGIALDLAARNGAGNGRLLRGLAAAATLTGGAFLRWGVVGAGQVSASDRETTLEAASPSKAAPGWGVAAG